MFSPWHLAVCLFVGVQLPTIAGVTDSCKKNRFIDYNQMLETSCLIETCVFVSNCSLTPLCPCKRDFVVRYNVTIDHDDDEPDSHLGVITQSPVDEEQVILVGREILEGGGEECFDGLDRSLLSVFLRRTRYRHDLLDETRSNNVLYLFNSQSDHRPGDHSCSDRLSDARHRIHTSRKRETEEGQLTAFSLDFHIEFLLHVHLEFLCFRVHGRLDLRSHLGQDP